MSSAQSGILKTVEVYHRRLEAISDGVPFEARPHLGWAARKVEYRHVATVTVCPTVNAKAQALGTLELVFRYMQLEPDYIGEAAHVATRFHRPRSALRPTSVGDILILDGRAYEVDKADFALIGDVDSDNHGLTP